MGARPSPPRRSRRRLSAAGRSISAGARLRPPPGIDSILSSVPPVWPSPRPESWGTAAPQAATSGHSGRLILSPTPPVECLSTVGPTDRGEVEPFATGDHRRCPRVELAVVETPEHDRHEQGRRLLLGHLAVGVRGQEPADLLVGQGPAIPLGPDDGDRVHQQTRACMRLASKAPGRISDIGLRRAVPVDQAVRPTVLPQELAAAPARHHRLPVAHGEDRDQSPTPVTCSIETRLHSAHRASP